MAEKETENKERYVVGQVPTQYADAVIDVETKTAFTTETALAKIMNDVEQLKKLLN